MDEQRPILVYGEKRIRYITINRDSKANALTIDMMHTIEHSIRTAPDQGCKAVVLSGGNSNVFCAGADIEEFCSVKGALGRQGEALRRLIITMYESPIVLLATARGTAAGAGAILLAMVDIVIGAESLEISCPEFIFNMYPLIVQLALETKLNTAKARQICLSRESLKAQLAKDMGIVTELVSEQNFPKKASEKLHFYLQRLDALEVALYGRHHNISVDELEKRLVKYESLMKENFGKVGVEEKINQYLVKLKGKR